MKILRLTLGRMLPLLVVVATTLTQAQTYKYSTLYSFTNNGTDPTFPQAPVILDNAGNIYGTSSTGGNFNFGTVFKLSKTGKLTVLYSFQGTPDGQTPTAAVVRDAAGNLYGTTSGGGTPPNEKSNCVTNYSGCGTVFQVSPSGDETVLYSFTGGNDGVFPGGPLALDSAGNLYGQAPDQLIVTGPSGYGTVYKIDTHGAFSTLYDFCPLGTTTGVCPAGYLGRQDYNSVTLDNGNLYGSAWADGNSDDGAAIFKITPVGVERVLHTFTGGADGEAPGNLTADVHGNLYGTTPGGGNQAPTLFRITTTGVKTILYTFCSLTNCADGHYPYSDVRIDKDGNLYGFVEDGGAYGCGGLFKYDTAGKETVPFSFACNGLSPLGGPAMDSIGNFYGAFLETNNSNGGVFKLTLVK